MLMVGANRLQRLAPSTKPRESEFLFQDKSVLLRFSDLKARNIVRNYVTLGRG